MALARMSALPRLMACPGFLTVAKDHDEASSENAEVARRWGTDAHAYKEGKERLVYGPLSEEDSEAQEQIRLAYVGWEHEVHVSYDLEECWAYMYSNEYEKVAWTDDRPLALTGCIDALMFDRDQNRCYVNDLKTSEDPVELDDPQLMGYLLTAYTLAVKGTRQLLPGASANLSCCHYPRKGWWRKKYLEEYGVPWRWYSRDVEIKELIEFRSKLIEVGKQAQQGILQASDSCVFCPGYGVCPMWQGSNK